MQRERPAAPPPVTAKGPPMLSQFDPYLVPLVTVVFALYGTVMGRGPLGYVAGGVGGLVWSLLVGSASAWLQRDAATALLGANASLFACIIASGLLMGGYLYGRAVGSVLAEPTATYAVLSALMRPAVPYFIGINSAMELLFVPFGLFLNWNAAPARRWIVAAAAALYVAHRAWTYLVYAERRLATGTSPLSEDDVAWYRRTFASDYRTVLNALIFALFAAAAFLPAGSG
jgi:hypothetical protein